MRRRWDTTKLYYVATAVAVLVSVCSVVSFALGVTVLGVILLAAAIGCLVICQFLARRDLVVRILRYQGDNLSRIALLQDSISRNMSDLNGSMSDMRSGISEITDTISDMRSNISGIYDHTADVLQLIKTFSSENEIKLAEILGINDQINLALTQELWFIRDTTLEISRGITPVQIPKNHEVLEVSPIHQPDVSIVVPVYNAARWLTECLDSVLRQTGVLTEIICINDGSTDQSAQILSEYSRQFANLKVITQDNAGLSVARNTGIAAATRRYLVFIDDDDYWRTNQLAELVHYADLHKLDLLVFNVVPFPALGVSSKHWETYPKHYQRLKEYSAPRTGLSLAAALSENGDYLTAAWQYLVATSLLEEYQLRFIPGIIHEDNAFTFQTFIAAKRAAQLAIPLYARRVRSGSIMTTRQPSRSANDLNIAAEAMAESLRKAAHNTDDYEYQQLEQIISQTRKEAQRQESQVLTANPSA